MPEVNETFYVDGDSVACDGGGGVLGHPLVYLAIDKSGQADCPYCSRRFVYRPGGVEPGELMTETVDESRYAGAVPGRPSDRAET
jgi:uncharacterized Zn-finger protein